MKFVFLPQPKKIVVGQGYFTLPEKGVIGIADHSLYSIAQRVRKLFSNCSIRVSASALKDTFAIRLNKSLKTGGYRLIVDTKGVLLEGVTVEAVFHGWQTLCQATRQSPFGKLPLLRIDDWPDIPDRGIYYDVTRGRVPKLEQLKQMVDTLAEYKINQLQLYIEHTFAFRGHPDIGKGASPLTAEDILELDAYCRERYVDLVPSLASFGHLATVLKHPQYHRLAEDWGVGKYVTPDKDKQKWLKDWLDTSHQYAFTLSPANPEVYKFLESLFAEFLPLFSSGRFNVCCDETVDLGYGQSYRLCKKLGKGRVYLNHILKLNDLCRKYGKKMMFWGDIIRHHPELIPEIPKDVTVLDWGYEYNHDFEAIRDFKKAGLKFYACPSVSSYSALFPRLPQARANISGFAKAVCKYGGQGLLNTDWGDSGHYNFMEYSWHGFLFGAEQGWNTKADQKSFTSRFCRLFLKSADARLATALDQLGEISHLYVSPYYQSIWKHIFFAYSGRPVFSFEPQRGGVARNGIIRSERVTLDAEFGKKTLGQLEAIRAEFKAHALRRGEDPLKILPYWIFAVDTLRHAARKLACYGRGAKAGADARSGLRRELALLKIRFRTLWLARNRPSEIRITLANYHKARKAVLTLTRPRAAVTD